MLLRLGFFLSAVGKGSCCDTEEEGGYCFEGTDEEFKSDLLKLGTGGTFLAF